MKLIKEFGELQIAGRKVREGWEPPDGVREAQQQLLIAAKDFHILDDLTPIIIKNETRLPFVASDNPAMVMNRLYSQRYSDPTAGLIQSGAVILMPLSPKLAFFAYDQDVYQMIGAQGVLRLRNESDVERLNELQVVRASDAIFFSKPDDQELATRLVKKYAHRRKTDWSLTWVGIRDGGDPFFERYRTVTDEDANSTEPRIQSVSPILPAPSIWPTFLKIRLRPKGYSDGSIVGFVRKAHAYRGRNLQVTSLPKTLPPGQSGISRGEIFQRRKFTAR